MGEIHYPSIEEMPLHSLRHEGRTYACDIPEARYSKQTRFDFRCYGCWLAGKAAIAQGVSDSRGGGRVGASAARFTLAEMVEAAAPFHDRSYA